MSGALLVAGTASDAGKSVVVAGLCRWLAREGVSVAPFKAQNMSNNSVATVDGAEIGRAQAMQALAAGVEPEAAMNPVLLKPGSDRSAQVVVGGRALTEVDALSYRELKPRLAAHVGQALAELRARFDVVVCEGAGSPAEINLRADDIANMGLARSADLPVLVVGDIDRGGVLASMYGTLALLEPADQALIVGFVVNKFRGDPSLLAPGLTRLDELTGRRCFGVLPWVEGLWADVEDSLSLDTARHAPHDGGEDPLRVAVVRLPRISNLTDADALAAEPGVAVRFVTAPAEVADADLVILPGTRATVADLRWLRERGLDAPLARRAATGAPVLGICGGYQMLTRSITDAVESGAGTVAGLGLLPARVTFAVDKIVRRVNGNAYGHPVHGYEIRHGRVELDTGAEAFLDGCRAGTVWGTSWHGALEGDTFRRAFLDEVAALRARRHRPPVEVSFAAERNRRLDVLGDLVAEHLDTAAIRALLRDGPPRDLGVVSTGLDAPGFDAPGFDAPGLDSTGDRPARLGRQRR